MMANEPITPEEQVARELDAWAATLRFGATPWEPEARLADRAASTIRTLQTRLAEADELKIADGWEPRGQSEMRCVRLNRKVYLAGSEGWRVSCLCATASAHVRAVEEGTCKTGLYMKPFENWRDAIRAAESEADHADAE